MNQDDADKPSADDAAASPPDQPGSGADEHVDAAAPVKRRRAPRKARADVDAVLPGVDRVGELAVHEAFADPMPHTATPAGAASLAEPANPPDDSDPADAGAHRQASPADGIEATTHEGPRRSRNRRRGRRGADGARRAEVGEQPRRDELGNDVSAGSVIDAAPRLPPPDVGELFANVLSGEFDVEGGQVDDAAVAGPAKRVLAAEVDAPKLQKVLAQSGIGSRRDMEQLIQEGRITVNGELAHVGQRISFGDHLRIDGKPIKARISPPPPRVLAYHKPAGEVATHDDPQHRPTVFRRLPRLGQGKWQSVGRLDINTEGLLLFTNSGELANQLMHPRFGVEREYAVRVLGAVDESARARLLEGVVIDGQSASFKSIEDGGGEGANRWLRVVITEGRNREVRKLFEAVGHAVSRLIRIRYGPVVLPRGLRRGMWVDLEEADVWTLRRIARPQRVPPPDLLAPALAANDGNGLPADAERRSRRGRKGRNDRRGAGDHSARRLEGPPTEPVERAPRPERAARSDHGERAERGEGGPIPNPLQQTYDKRAIQQARAQRADIGEDGPIPNPLQQTYDKRAMQQARTPRAEYGEDGPIPNPLQQTYDKRFVQGGKAGARGQAPGGGRSKGGQRARKGQPASRQPDPMQTSGGYIGADAFVRKSAGQGRGGAGGGGPGSGAAGARGKGRRGGRGSGGGNGGGDAGGRSR